MVNLFIILALAFVIFLISGFGINGIALIFLVPAIVLCAIFVMGLTMLLSALNVFFRDIQYIVTVVLMVLIWLTPIMYVRGDYGNIVFNTILTINPMTYFTDLFQCILYWKAIPTLSTFLICIGISTFFLTVGALVFKHLEKNFAEVL